MRNHPDYPWLELELGHKAAVTLLWMNDRDYDTLTARAIPPLYVVRP